MQRPLLFFYTSKDVEDECQQRTKIRLQSSPCTNSLSMIKTVIQSMSTSRDNVLFPVPCTSFLSTYSIRRSWLWEGTQLGCFEGTQFRCFEGGLLGDLFGQLVQLDDVV